MSTMVRLRSDRFALLCGWGRNRCVTRRGHHGIEVPQILARFGEAVGAEQ